MAPSQQFINTGASIPTTSDFDLQQLSSVDLQSQEFRELLIRLYQTTNQIQLAVNLRDVGYYPQTEFVNGQLFFPATYPNPERPVYRIVVNFGALPNNSTKSVAHGIDMGSDKSKITFTRIYGTASDTTNFVYIPLPLAGNAAPISMLVDDEDVFVTTTNDRTDYDTTYIVLEYLKQ